MLVTVINSTSRRAALGGTSLTKTSWTGVWRAPFTRTVAPLALVERRCVRSRRRLIRSQHRPVCFHVRSVFPLPMSPRSLPTSSSSLLTSPRSLTPLLRSFAPAVAPCRSASVSGIIARSLGSILATFGPPSSAARSRLARSIDLGALENEEKANGMKLGTSTMLATA